MARVLARLSLVLGAGLLTAAMAAGPAMAGPQEADGAATRSDGSKVPAPRQGGTAPTQPRTEIPPESGLRSGPLAAVPLNGVCDAFAGGGGELCLWFLSGYGGSLVDYYYGDNNFWNNVFLSAGSGQGVTVANDPRSAYNYDSLLTAWVCTSPSQFGSCGFIRPRSGGNFVPRYFADTESFHWTL
jgi:hypothetical protein